MYSLGGSFWLPCVVFGALPLTLFLLFPFLPVPTAVADTTGPIQRPRKATSIDDHRPMEPNGFPFGQSMRSQAAWEATGIK